MELEEIILDIKSILSDKRFNHCLGVMKRAEELAKIHGINIEIAKKVGIAHDIAKEMSLEESLEYVKENDIHLDEIEENVPYLLHGKIGAHITGVKYDFTIEMQNAIIYHTTGNPEMDMLAKIIFVADKTEENRIYENINVDYERKLANQDINKGMIYILEETIKMNIDKNKLVHPDSILTRNRLILEEMKKN